MRTKVDDWICYELSWAMKGCLSASHRFHKLSATTSAKICLLLIRYCSDFSTAACIDRIELCSYNVWGWSGEGGRRFRCKEAGDDGFLEASGGGIWDDRWEVNMYEGPHWAY